MNGITSPWLTLSANPPFLASCDIDAKPMLRDFYNLHLEILPQPYLGDVCGAKVIVLLLNPGYTSSESTIELRSNKLQKALRENLDPKKSRLLFLDEEFDWTAGGRWWRKILSAVFDSGVSVEDVHRNMAVVEYFPYHSTEFRMKPNTTLPSQDYSFEIVRNAVARNATVLLMRGDKWWLSTVPELAEADVIKPKSTRNAVLSENNLGEHNFARLVGLLRS